MQLDVQIYADRYEATLNKILETSQELDKGLEDIFQAYTKDDPLADKVMVSGISEGIKGNQTGCVTVKIIHSGAPKSCPTIAQV